MVQKSKAKRALLIGDTHFGDADIIRYERPQFKNVSEMDNFLIEQWNSCVTDDDAVFVLGDFSLHPFEKTQKICDKLNGTTILIKGNHDLHDDDFYKDCGIFKVYEFPIIIDGFWILSHEPMYMNDAMPYANIFAHVHNSRFYRGVSPNGYCVSAEREYMNFKPKPFDDIKSAVKWKHENEFKAFYK